MAVNDFEEYVLIFAVPFLMQIPTAWSQLIFSLISIKVVTGI
jgi:hypothetical protein